MFHLDRPMYLLGYLAAQSKVYLIDKVSIPSSLWPLPGIIKLMLHLDSPFQSSVQALYCRNQPFIGCALQTNSLHAQGVDFAPWV